MPIPGDNDDNTPMLDPSQVSRRSLFVVVLASVFVIGGFAIWQARPLYHWVQGLRAVQQLPKARQLADDERYQSAFQLMHKLYHMAPENPHVLRTAGEISVAAKSPEAVEFYEKLVALNEATYEDRRELGKIYSGTRRFDSAREVYRHLLEERPDDPILLFQVADLHLLLNDHRLAMESLNNGLKVETDNDERRLLLARLLIQHGLNDKEKLLGWKYVLQTAQRDDEVGLGAIQLLVSAPQLTPQLELALSDLIEAHPLTTEPLKIEALRRRALANPESRSKIIVDAVADRSDGEPRDLVSLYRWLSTEEEHDLILKNLTLETALLNQDLFVIYLHSLGKHRNDWSRVKELLDDPTVPLAPPIRMLCLAFTAQESGEDETAVEGHMRAALRTAQLHGETGGVFGIGAYAESLGLYEQAETAYALADRSPELARAAFEGQIRLAKRRGDSIAVREILYRYHYRYPDRANLIEECLYLNALLGIEIESTLEKASRIIEEEPFRVFPRIITALAFYRMYNLPKAEQTVRAGESLQIDEMSPGELIAYTAILGATNRPDEARRAAHELTRDVSTETLLKEEQRILAPWLP